VREWIERFPPAYEAGQGHIKRMTRNDLRVCPYYYSTEADLARLGTAAAAAWSDAKIEIRRPGSREGRPGMVLLATYMNVVKTQILLHVYCSDNPSLHILGSFTFFGR
jgi:hypothetical protein